MITFCESFVNQRSFRWLSLSFQVPLSSQFPAEPVSCYILGIESFFAGGDIARIDIDKTDVRNRRRRSLLSGSAITTMRYNATVSHENCTKMHEKAEEVLSPPPRRWSIAFNSRARRILSRRLRGISNAFCTCSSFSRARA